MSGVLRGKTAVITGGSRGLGLAIAEAFGAAGASVVIGSRSSKSVAHAVRHLKAQDIRATGVVCDVGIPSHLGKLADYARRQFGGFDLWVNNAGVSAPYGPTAEIGAARFEEVVATNILGTYHGSMAALREFLPKNSGKLINLLGRGDRQPAPFQSAYGSSKSWVRSFTLALAQEYRESGVGIFVFNPGLVRTDLLLQPEVIAGWEGRLQGFYRFIVSAWGSSPKDAAQRALWLAGPATDGKTGREVTSVGAATILVRSLGYMARRIAGHEPSAAIQLRIAKSNSGRPRSERFAS